MLREELGQHADKVLSVEPLRGASADGGPAAATSAPRSGPAAGLAAALARAAQPTQLASAGGPPALAASPGHVSAQPPAVSPDCASVAQHVAYPAEPSGRCDEQVREQAAHLQRALMVPGSEELATPEHVVASSIHAQAGDASSQRCSVCRCVCSKQPSGILFERSACQSLSRATCLS